MKWTEQVPPGEAAEHELLAARLRRLQEARKPPIGRALHLKAVAAARGEIVIGDVPEGLRVGIFGTPGRFPAVVRWSNGAGRRQRDGEPDVRGMAVKVLGVPGQKLIPALADATTQDFLAITSEVTPFRTADEFVTTLEATAGPLLLAPLKLMWALGPGRALGLLGDLRRELGAELAHYAEKPFFSALPIRWGDEAVKFAFVPTAVAQTGPIDRTDRDHYGADLVKRLRAGPMAFELRVQRWVDEVTTPIEDAAVRWTSPWEGVARLELPQQDLEGDAGRSLAERAEAWSFDPWHAPVEFRPLGAVMRARNVAYRESTMARKAAAEPTTV
jgi:hypothetical protein